MEKYYLLLQALASRISGERIKLEFSSKVRTMMELVYIQLFLSGYSIMIYGI